MSSVEHDINKKDLNAYVSGQYAINAMLPGQPSPHIKGGKINQSKIVQKEQVNPTGSKSFLSLDFLEK